VMRAIVVFTLLESLCNHR